MIKIPKQIRILKDEPLLFLTLPIAIPLLIIIIFLSPILHIRIGFLHSDRIGHFSLNTELSILEKKFFGVKIKSLYQIDLYYLPKESCNKTLEALWRKQLFILPKLFLRPICLVIRSSKFLTNNFHCGGTINGDRDTLELLDKYPPTITLTDEFINKGQKELFRFGIPSNAKYICLIARDNSYLKSLYGKNITFHDYRNVDIDDFVIAAEELTNLGYYVFRMGSVVSKPISTNNKMIIDYAYDGKRSDFMDIFLGATCEFCITTSLGFDNIPMIFRRPNLYINHSPLFWARLECSDNIEVPAMYYSKKKKRLLTLSEVFEFKIADILDSQHFSDKKITVVQHSKNDIKEAALEMHLRVNNQWLETDEDRILQKRFKSLFPNERILRGKKFHGKINSKIGAHFLRTNKWWLN
jgi:putative glycosyltransferase (TIGR04372 family)